MVFKMHKRNNSLLAVLLIGLLIQKSYSFPSAEEEEKNSSEDDSLQQQQQTVNTESLEEFSTQVNTKGKVEKLQTPTAPVEVDPCLEEKRVGPCKAAIPRIFFNKVTAKCETFRWGGCGKTGKNHFKSLAACESACAKHLPIVSILRVPNARGDEEEQEVCILPPVHPTGEQCEALIPRWTYNATQGRCIEYISNGCQSKNNFKNRQSCQATCGNYTAKPDPRKDDGLSPPPIATSLGTKDRRVCDLPKEIGFCYALKKRYFFNKKNNRCEVLNFGGCGANGNHFKTVEECVRLCGGDAPSENEECSDVNCPWELYTHYKTQDCKPIYDGQSCCPTRFDCPDTTQQQLNNTLGEGRSLSTGEPTSEDSPSSPPQCRYKGKSYKVGEDVSEASDPGSCRAACFCSETQPGKAKIMCASIECPEHLGSISPEKRNCVPLYKKGSCCAYDFYCPNDTLIIQEPDQQAALSGEEEQPVFKCNMDGKSFYEGQRFYPKESKCLRCICGKGFGTTLSDEFCESIDCGIEIYYSDYITKGCSPVYYQSGDGSTSCCPISWECPDNNDDGKGITTDSSPPSSVGTTTRTTPETSEVGPVPVTPAIEPPLVVPTSSTVDIFIPPPQMRNKHLLLTQSACNMPKEIGNCKGHRSRYFYNKDANNCEEFEYSGCGGSDNNFVSQKDCQRLCITSDTPESTPLPADNKVLGRSLDANTAQQHQTPQREERAIYVTEVDPCTMRKETGRCKGYFLRYFYSPESNSCDTFVFGGCKGNFNNFYSKESCEASCTRALNVQGLRTSVPSGKESRGDASMVKFGEDATTASQPSKSVTTGDTTSSTSICSLEKKTGFCKAYVTRYYFDSVEGRCMTFVFGGCRPNANNFKSLEECERRCPESGSNTDSRTAQVAQVQPTGDKNFAVIQGGQGGGGRGDDDSVSGWRSSSSNRFLERCRLPMKAGSCQAIIPSYFYDTETNTCNYFLFSGCFGNANRFGSLSECEDQCKQPDTTAQNEGIGGRMSMTGLPWRQNRVAAEEGGESSSRGEGVGTLGPQTEVDPPTQRQRPAKPMPLPTPEEAEEVCKLAPVQGPCRAHILRFHWDPKLGFCIPFVYSGCRGNLNNFVSESDCASVCRKEPTIEQLTSDCVLSCSFGNETIPVGGTVRKFRQNKRWNPNASPEEQLPCGIPICQCITPPSVTCFQTSCPTQPPPTTTEKVCPTPTCGANCVEATGLDGCPTCDCDESQSQVQVQEIFIKPVKS